MRQAMLAAVEKAAEDLLRDANQTIPVDTGAMRSSGETDSEETPTGVKAVVSYDTVYAVRQHEDLSLNHKSGQRGMWLKYTADENKWRYVKTMQTTIRGKAGSLWV